MRLIGPPPDATAVRVRAPGSPALGSAAPAGSSPVSMLHFRRLYHSDSEGYVEKLKINLFSFKLSRPLKTLKLLLTKASNRWLSRWNR